MEIDLNIDGFPSTPAGTIPLEDQISRALFPLVQKTFDANTATAPGPPVAEIPQPEELHACYTRETRYICVTHPLVDAPDVRIQEEEVMHGTTLAITTQPHRRSDRTCLRSFDLVVVGGGGGPSETNLSSYLFKPCDVPGTDGIIALEAGSRIGALHHLINRNATLFDGLSAHQVYSLIHCFLLSHAHLDHVAGLILSIGSLHGIQKRVWAPASALKTLETIFSDRIWPNLASWDEDDAPSKLLYRPLKFDDAYQTIFRDSVSVRTMPVLHRQNDTQGGYQSSAFFVRNDASGQQFLFFGDVAPDSPATHAPQTIAVWRAAAPLIPHALSALFIECSWPSGRPDEQLYGHLSPEHLADELVALAAEVTAARLAKAAAEGAVASDDRADAPPPEPKRHRKRRVRRRKMSAGAPAPPLGPLAGLRVYITHCKEDLEGKYDKPISEVIRDQVDALVRAKGLGAEVLSTCQGMTITI